MPKKRRKRSPVAGPLKKGRPGRKSALSMVPLSALRDELERRQSAASHLLDARNRLAAELDSLDAELEALGLATSGARAGAPRRGPGRPRGSKNAVTKARAKTGGRGGRRPKNEMNLVQALKQVLTDATMGVSEAADAVLKAGYRTSSPNFRTIVNQTLLSKKDTFKKVDRGRYTAK